MRGGERVKEFLRPFVDSKTWDLCVIWKLGEDPSRYTFSFLGFFVRCSCESCSYILFSFTKKLPFFSCLLSLPLLSGLGDFVFGSVIDFLNRFELKVSTFRLIPNNFWLCSIRFLWFLSLLPHLVF